MNENAAHLPEGTLIAGKLRVLRLLGMGGMGAVYEVEHELTKHRRALKMLHAQFRAYPTVIARFLREASAAGRIGNPHIIETFDAGELESGEPYLVMEYLEGETLSDLIGRKGRLSVGELADLLSQACVGVQAAHDRGIVHRDLKPDNLFIITRDNKPFVKLLDFGVSKFDAELTGGMGMTKEGATLGTPFYMPPEQVRGEKDIDARADVYALGVILYECASGKRPFEADTLPHLALLIHEGKPQPLEELRPDLPQGFADLVRRAMASDRKLRFGSARELAEALSHFGGVSLDATMEGQAPIMMRTGSASSAVHSADSLGPTMPGQAISVAQEGKPAKSSKTGIIVAAAALVLVAGGGLAVRSMMHSPAPESPSAATATTAPTAAPVVTPAAVPTLIAPVETTAPPASASAIASTSAAAKPPTRPTPPTIAATPPAAHPPAATPATSPPANKNSTRADQKGLANDNPFK
jgi:serine/threonine-protein kinase